MKQPYRLAILLLSAASAVAATGCFSITRTETDIYTITQRDTTIRESVRNVPGERENGTIYPSTRTVEITRNYVNRDSTVKRYYPAFVRFGGFEAAGFLGTGGSTDGTGNGLFGLYQAGDLRRPNDTKILTGYMYRVMPYEVQMRIFNDDPNWTIGTAAFETFINQRDSSAELASDEQLMGVLPIYVRKRFFLREKPPYVMVVPFFGLGLIPSQYVNFGATFDVGSYGGFNIRAYAGYVSGTRLLINNPKSNTSNDVSFPYFGVGVSALDFVNHPDELKVEWKDHHHNAIEVDALNFDLFYSIKDSVKTFNSKSQKIGSFPTGFGVRFASANFPLPIADGNFFVGTSLFNGMAFSKGEIAFGFFPIRLGYRRSLIENDLNLEPFAEYMYYPSTSFQVGVKTSLQIYDWTRMGITVGYATGSLNLDVMTGLEELASIADFSTFYVSVGLGIGDVIHTKEEVNRP